MQHANAKTQHIDSSDILVLKIILVFIYSPVRIFILFSFSFLNQW